MGTFIVSWQVTLRLLKLWVPDVWTELTGLAGSACRLHGEWHHGCFHKDFKGMSERPATVTWKQSPRSQLRWQPAGICSVKMRLQCRSGWWCCQHCVPPVEWHSMHNIRDTWAMLANPQQWDCPSFSGPVCQHSVPWANHSLMFSHFSLYTYACLPVYVQSFLSWKRTKLFFTKITRLSSCVCCGYQGIFRLAYFSVLGLITLWECWGMQCIF